MFVGNGSTLFQTLVVAVLSVIAFQLLAFNKVLENSLHLPVQSSNPALPCVSAATSKNSAEKDLLALDRVFTHDDFETYFGLSVLHTVQVDQVIASYVAQHDTSTDDKDDSADDQHLAQHLSHIFDRGLRNDKRFYIKYIGPEKGYGLFAAVDITPKSVVALYTGIITNNSISDYQWEYPSKVIGPDGEDLNLGIDSRYMGNWARFVNHSDDPNCDSIYVLYNGLWHVVYMSTRTIRKGEEVTVSYGNAYWESRDIKRDE
ncbi:hypothetical protein BJ742DRAFT_793767 [Cladochytrium replicatum]|nr:hypothetical protein BJ742DRAFT_793767 [Cladochytrium replicatum]